MPTVSNPALVSATEASFRQSNGALWGWALVMGVSVLSFLVHVHPDEGMAAEHTGQGLLAMGAAMVLAQGGTARWADDWSGRNTASAHAAEPHVAPSHVVPATLVATR